MNRTSPSQTQKKAVEEKAPKKVVEPTSTPEPLQMTFRGVGKRSVHTVYVPSGTKAIYVNEIKVEVPAGETWLEFETEPLRPLPEGQSYWYTVSLEGGRSLRKSFKEGQRVTFDLTK